MRWEYDSTMTKAISGRRARPWTVFLQRRLSFVGDSFRVASFLFELKLFVALGMGAALFSYLHEVLQLRHIGLVGHNGFG